MPAHISAQIDATGGMWDALTALAPGMRKAARVSRASTSAGLYNSASGDLLPGSGGAHHYVLVKDAGDIERFLRNLHDRCWLNRLGWHQIGGSGQLLERSLVDRMVGFGERLCFEGAPVIVPPLAQDLTKRQAEAFEGEPIDTSIVVPKLNEYELQLVKEAKAKSAASLVQAAAEVQNRHDHMLAEKLSAHTGMPLLSASRLVLARHRGVLLPCIELVFDHLGTVSVADVLADPERFVGETLADPLEGVDYGRCKAKVMIANGGGLLIHSFAHGRSIYHLRYDARSAKAAVAQAPADGVVDYTMAILATTDLEPDELADITAIVAEAANVPKTAITARIKKEHVMRENAARKARLASGEDGRIVLQRPATDGELTPVVRFLDQTFAEDAREEPPMRDATGKLVEVQVREPWNLHLLTSDGTNGTPDDDTQMKAPAEPSFVQLSLTSVELRIEQYVRWEVRKRESSYFAATPRPYVEALMQISPSDIPVARAINTAPLVALSGNVIEGVGLDRSTGLVHRIDPLLRACLPATAPTEQDVGNALKFLMDEWLVDVALDPIGKCVAIMLAMTLIERTLLPERPAFFVTAGQRGGGKTTLVNMITLAVLGRIAAAASWSNDPEERKKALFSYLRQGVASITWDNIPRGATISCPHIEAALTAREVSDRVLGSSRAQTVPSTTIHTFTGNNILPRGDMASRSLSMGLKVERPDPENRSFAHADPLAWTQANRAKIVSALYTVLIAGALNRPVQQEAKTRFKMWWKLVGWPAEYAAGLLGIKLDCTELMRASEVGDEEASTVSAVLVALQGLFGDDGFTSRDVVDVMATQGGLGNDADEAKAAAIVDAISQLAGKKPERPTAHYIGKLFQKALVGRPAWLGDTQTTATLRNTPGHGNNTYRIEVRNRAGVHPDVSDEKPSAFGGNLGKQSPQSPQSPQPPSKFLHSGGAGNVGKQGVVSHHLPEDGSDLV